MREEEGTLGKFGEMEFCLPIFLKKKKSVGRFKDKDYDGWWADYDYDYDYDKAIDKMNDETNNSRRIRVTVKVTRYRIPD